MILITGEMLVDYVKHFYLMRLNRLKVDFYAGLKAALFKRYHLLHISRQATLNSAAGVVESTSEEMNSSSTFSRTINLKLFKESKCQDEVDAAMQVNTSAKLSSFDLESQQSIMGSFMVLP
jgi:Eukaryotic membrane protein family